MTPDLRRVIGRRVRRLLPLSCLECDRIPFGRVLELVRFLEGGGKVPPIRVMLAPQGRWRVKDGRHRYAAFKLLGIKLVEVEHALHPAAPLPGPEKFDHRRNVKPQLEIRPGDPDNIPFLPPPGWRVDWFVT